MALAGHAALVSVSSDNVTYNEVDGLANVDFGPSATIIETTDFADTTAAKTRIKGLADLNVTVSGQYEASDTGQALIRSSWASGATIHVKFLPNGSAGFRCPCIVQDYKINTTVDGAVEFSATFLGNGAIVAV